MADPRVERVVIVISAERQPNDSWTAIYSGVMGKGQADPAGTGTLLTAETDITVRKPLIPAFNPAHTGQQMLNNAIQLVKTAGGDPS